MSLAEWRKNKLEEHGIKYLFNFSSIDNLPSIIKNGILPKNFVSKTGIKTTSFAEESVQERRHNKIVKLSDHSQVNLHDLVPLYLTPKTPTLHARKNIQSEIFFLVISIALIYDEKNNFCFTDGNAASESTVFFRNLKDLSALPTEVINAEYWSDFDDGKRKRCTEFLVYPRVDIKYIIQFVVLDDDTRSTCSNIMKQLNCDIPMSINTDFFFTDNFG